MRNANIAKFILASFLIVIAGCSSNKQGVGSQGASLPSDGGGGDGTAPPADASKMYVEVVQDPDHPQTTYLHVFGDFNKACEIEVTDGPTDLKCLLNIREEDLYFYGLKWDVNVAPNMCSFVVHRPYFYYNFQAGVGPASINLTLTQSGSNPPVIASCDIGSVPGTVSGNYCNFPGGEGTVDSAGSTTCAYNYEDGISCCEGKYSITKTTVSGSTTNIEFSQGDWGGKLNKCWGGIITQDGWPRNAKDVPITTRYYEGRFGLLLTVDGFSPLEMYGGGGGGSNVHLANMYGWSSMPNNHNSAPIPQGIAPTTDRSGSTGIPALTEAYTYECRDESGEVKHRIRMYVNDWNTNDEWTKYTTSSAAQGTPDLDGVDGTNCAIGGAVNAGKCNDYTDWDDLEAKTYKYPNQYK